MNWHGVFVRLVVRQVRASGWGCAFVLKDYEFRPLGTRTVQCDLVHHNDNHPAA